MRRFLTRLPFFVTPPASPNRAARRRPMRKLRIATTGILVVLMFTGCARMREREWGSCAVAGGLIGATIGGVTGGVTVNNVADDPNNANRGGAIAGGAVAGGAIGALLGHLICDP